MVEDRERDRYMVGHDQVGKSKETAPLLGLKMHSRI